MSVILRDPNGDQIAITAKGEVNTAPRALTLSGYIASVSGQANTASADILAVESGPALTTVLRRIIIFHPGTQNTAGLRVLQLVRTTTAGTAGVVTPAPTGSPNDPAFTGIVRAKPTAQGTGGVVLLNLPIFVPNALAAFTPLVFDLDDIARAFGVPLGVANGLALRDPGAAGAANLSAAFVFTEE